MKKTIQQSGFLIVLMLWVVQVHAQEGYEIGDKAIDFSLKDVSGEMVSMSDYPDAKGFIVIFSCNTCPYVVAYEDRMIALHEKYAPQGYPLIAINPNDDQKSPGDSYAKMQERAQEKNFPFPYVYDETQKVIKAYGGTRTPHVYLLNKEGEDLIVKYIGTIDNNYQDPDAVSQKYVDSAVDALLNGNAIAMETTKAIGCTIKWRK